MRRLLWFLAFSAPLSAQTIGNGVTVGAGVTIGAPGPVTPTGIFFAPPAGHYFSTQSVAITSVPSSGIQLHYTLDGGTPTAASTLYSGPLSIASNQTIKVTAQIAGTTGQDTGTSSTHWKCVTPSAGTWGGLTCQSGGGVGSHQPSNVSWTWGTTMQENVSTTSTSGETQILYVYSGPGCDNCNTIAQDKWVQPIGDSSIIANNEIDMYHNDSTRDRLHMFGLQCNQSGTNAGHWQIDNQQGSWQTTSILTGCPWSTTNWTRVIYEGHWINGDTGCGGYGCNYYDALSIETCSVDPASHGGTCPAANVVIPLTRYVIGQTLEAYTEPGWASVCGNQDQIDLTNTATSGHNPTVGGRKVQLNNVSCTYGTQATGNATYTIP